MSQFWNVWDYVAGIYICGSLMVVWTKVLKKFRIWGKNENCSGVVIREYQKNLMNVWRIIKREKALIENNDSMDKE